MKWTAMKNMTMHVGSKYFVYEERRPGDEEGKKE